jgi:hypothetical protein
MPGWIASLPDPVEKEQKTEAYLKAGSVLTPLLLQAYQRHYYRLFLREFPCIGC